MLFPQRHHALSKIKRCNFIRHSSYYCYKSNDNVIKSNIKVEKPSDRITLYKFLTGEMKKHGEKTALLNVENGIGVTYNKLLETSSKVASFLHDKGYDSNDCIGIHAPNCLEYVYAIFGAMEKGITFTTANPAYTHYELAGQWKNSNPCVLFTNKQLVDLARKSVENTNVDLLVSLDDAKVNDSGVVNLSEILEEYEPLQTDQNKGKDDDIAYLLYSSGTTGLPKGVMLTQANIKIQILQILEHFKWKLEERHLMFLPLYHSFALMSLLFASFYGCSMYLMNGFQPEQFLSSIQKYQIQRLAIVPSIALFMLNEPTVANYDLTSVKTLFVGAAPLEENVLNGIEEKFPFMVPIQAYGATELSPACTSQPNEKELHCTGSAGLIFPNTDMRIVDIESGENCSSHERGEIWIKGPQVMKGYLNNKEATEGCITPDGWFKTGDLGYYDDNLNLFVVDRLKELIKYKGLQVAPAELEDLLLSHPSILDSCVIGLPDERAGELPRAYLVTSDEHLTAEDVHEYLNERVADFKKLRGGIVFVKEIPKSPTGKILRRVLKDELIKNI